MYSKFTVIIRGLVVVVVVSHILLLRMFACLKNDDDDKHQYVCISLKLSIQINTF